ncbi:OmpA family protein [Pontibacter silvestris]|uniref:OmpA family protein n=1 Tax=Pontibacter silvestris TaxID=2305183 RepID=A0ABW4WXE3_9BACT|nr:OmpA family protein [Pontibacter silvestris]MCC9136765.1 OmpA family protein [Pontibacter silvestris]
MRSFIIICVLLFSSKVASAQHDLYKWQLSGYTGIANYINENNSTSDYFNVNDNLVYRVELSRNIGHSIGLSLGYSFGNVRGHDQLHNSFTTGVRMSALRAYFYTDNGWLLNTSAWVAPYFFGGYGLSTFETSSGVIKEESTNVPAIPFGLGLKFRIAERWQLAVQAEAVYLTKSHLQVPALEQNDHNNTYLHTGIRLGYSFGFKESTFKAPRFYAGNLPVLQSVEGLNQPRQNVLEMMLKLEPKEVQINNIPDSANLVQPVSPKRVVILPADTLTASNRIDVDSSSSEGEISEANVVSSEPVQIQGSTTRPIRTISSAGTMIRLDSVVVKSNIPPAPTVQRRIVVAEEPVSQRQGEVVTSEQVEVQEATAVRENKPVRVQETYSLRTEEAVPARASETERVVERVVYVPAESSTERVRSVDADITQLREERLRLAALNAEVSRSQARINALQAERQTDTVMLIKEAAADTSMVQYLQQQAALNDSMLQRLNQYEQELALLRNKTAAPVSEPTAVTPKENVTTVFYPINSYRVPSESLRDLNQVLQVLQQNSDLNVKLTGYTSQSGNAAYNMALSRKRVEALDSFLTDQGIAKKRIRTEYLGDEKSSQKENPLDRKVEIEIIE